MHNIEFELIFIFLFFLNKKYDESVYAFECFLRGEAPPYSMEYEQTTME